MAMPDSWREWAVLIAGVLFVVGAMASGITAALYLGFALGLRLFGRRSSNRDHS
jgi:hypothetical protein